MTPYRLVYNTGVAEAWRVPFQGNPCRLPGLLWRWRPQTHAKRWYLQYIPVFTASYPRRQKSS